MELSVLLCVDSVTVMMTNVKNSMSPRMKVQSIYLVSGLVVLFIFAFGWKLNDYYQVEKINQQLEKIHQQTLSLKTPISTQLSQLKNILSSYAYKIDEAQINWVQLEPFIALAQVKLGANNQFEVKDFFPKAGSKADRWTKGFLQKGLAPLKQSKRQRSATTVAKLFQTRAGEKFITLIFLDKPEVGAEGIAVVSDVAYFQKFFDLQRSRKMTHVLMTDEDVVAAHSEPEYIASITAESALKPEKFFIDTEDLRSTNLKIISYAPKSSTVSKLSMPPSLLGLLLGFLLVLLGGLYYIFKPVEKLMAYQKKKQKEDAFHRAVAQSAAEVDAAPVPADLRPASLIKESKASVLPAANTARVSEAATSFEQAQSVLAQFALPVKTGQAEPTKSFEPAESAKAPASVSADWGYLFVPTVQPEIPAQSLNESLRAAIDLLRPLFEEHSVKLQTDLLSRIEFKNDPQRLQKMFENILKNALDSVIGRQIKMISVRSYDTTDTAVVEIQDSGGGIATENIEKIWQPFFTTKKKELHKGLGLSESLSVARRFGGELQVSNHPQGGVLVKIIMPGGLVTGLEKQAKSEMAQKIEKPMSAESSLPDLDIDAILSLAAFETTEAAEPITRGSLVDHSTAPASTVKDLANDIAKEFEPTHFKIDKRLEIVEDPKIQFNRPSYSVDSLEVRIRKPEKS